MKRPRTRRRKKEPKSLISPAYIASKVYASTTADINNMLNKIYLAQEQITNSPNFFYKGGVYILKKKTSANPLDQALRSSMDSYLHSFKQKDELIKNFKFAVSRLISDNVTYSDLYYIFPDTGHMYLEGIVEFVERDPDYVKDLLTKDINEVQLLVKEQALYDLIG